MNRQVNWGLETILAYIMGAFATGVFVAILVAIFTTSTQGCTKPKDEPAIYGEWRTISGLPTPVEYRITEGEICQRFDDYPPGTRLCEAAALAQSGDTLYLNGATKHVWVLDFKSPDVVNVMQANPDFTVWEAVFTLERK